jgi:hypothetical protein
MTRRIGLPIVWIFVGLFASAIPPFDWLSGLNLFIAGVWSGIFLDEVLS